ncbi:MAG: DUF2442 domain-containing protein [Spirochaetales bacterium]|nr:DUF2442 domain-containing protein [Candidatus Physcosoma equi]
MFEMNGICYAGSFEEGIEVSSIKILDGGMLLITFSSGETRLFDVLTLLSKGSAFAPLSKEENRKTAQVTFGFVSWMDGEIDIAPETMYQESYPYTPKAYAI